MYIPQLVGNSEFRESKVANECELGKYPVFIRLVVHGRDSLNYIDSSKQKQEPAVSKQNCGFFKIPWKDY